MTDDTRPRRGTYDRSLSADERAAEQRDRIIDAATMLYGEKGYYETRLEDIVSRAQVSRRTVYAHFRDLEELRFAVYERAMSRTLLNVGQLAQDTTPADRLATVLTAMFKSIADNPQLSRAVVYEFRLPEPRNVALRSSVIAFFVSVLMEGIREDIKVGQCAVEPDELSLHALVCAFEGLAFRYIDGPDPASALEAVPVALRVFRSVYPFHPKPRDDA